MDRFTRLTNDYFFVNFGPPQDLGARQNISSRNTKHLRTLLGQRAALAPSRQRAHVREVSADRRTRRCWRPANAASTSGRSGQTIAASRLRFPRRPDDRLPTEVPITFGDSRDDWQLHEAGGRRNGADLCESRQPVCEKGRQQPGLRPARISRKAGWKSISSARAT